MSPIDRVTQRAQAFTVLGVPATANQEDIRKAYRQLAFEKHPDRNAGTTNEFARIAEAYRFVSENADELGIKPATPKAATVRPRTVSRPTVQASETSFDQTTIDECRSLAEAEGGPGTVHISTAVYRFGRRLTYFVPSALENGRNEVVVPTGMLVDSRKALPKIVAFDSREAAGGCFEVPGEDCEEHFPGARRIQIRFATA